MHRLGWALVSVRRVIFFLVLSIFLLSGIPTASASADGSLTVGLYPWVPRLEQFQAVIQGRWAEVEPTVSLNFLSAEEWDGGYDFDPPANADVFVFDAVFLDYFRAQGWLEMLSEGEIQNPDDFLEYAISGVRTGGGYDAIPLLGCTNILFYQKDDAALAAATTLSQVKAALSSCTYTSQIPPDRRGLMADMAGGTTNATLYLDAYHGITGAYPMPLPWDPSQVDPASIANLRSILTMASYWNATKDPGAAYGRGVWFNQYGRALVGFTESMSVMSPAMRARVAFKVMPLADQAHRPLFYADVVGVNTTTQKRGTRALAVKLANVIAASETVVEALGADATHADPQYLLATRPSVFAKLAESFPVYQDLFALTQTDPLLFRIGEQARSWLNTMKATIQDDVRAGYACGCDYTSPQPIFNNVDAQTKCPPVCAAHGGWNGQWTNVPPAPGSVCGCRGCPVGGP